jgi:GR25 family glycosyltransferase involved in LPS biosynthesis
MNPRTFILTVDRPIQRFDDTAAHLDSLGVEWERFDGFDNQLCRLNPIETFDLDRVGERIGSKHVAACLSHYLLWKVMLYAPEEVFWVLEYDARMADDWDVRIEQIMRDLPDDWQVVMLGSCCCKGRETTHISGEVYEVKYPLCGHAMMYRKSALPILLQEHQRIWAPLDIALYHGAFPKLRVYTILPPLVTQAGTPLPP